MRTRIVGTGFVTGENLVTNERLTTMMDTSDAWIRERSGVEKDEIDYIVFATMTPDHYFPGCGGLLQQKLGLATIPALDIRQQCTGFIYGLQVADALIKAEQARTVLLVGAEVH